MSSPLDFAAFSELLGAPADAKELREQLDTMARRVRVLEERQRALLDLAADPEQAHRMITRKEIVRTLKGEPLA